MRELIENTRDATLLSSFCARLSKTETAWGTKNKEEKERENDRRHFIIFRFHCARFLFAAGVFHSFPYRFDLTQRAAAQLCVVVEWAGRSYYLFKFIFSSSASQSFVIHVDWNGRSFFTRRRYTCFLFAIECIYVCGKGKFISFSTASSRSRSAYFADFFPFESFRRYLRRLCRVCTLYGNWNEYAVMAIYLCSASDINL